MSRVVALNSSYRHDAQSFDIFDDRALTPDKHVHVDATGNIDVLKELSHGQSQNRVTPAGEIVVGSPLAKSPGRDTTSPGNKAAKAQNNRRASRARRPQIDSETFEPLGAVPEETSSLIEPEENLVAISPATKDDKVKGSHAKVNEDHPPGILDSESALEEQVEKHLAATPLNKDSYPTSQTMDGTRAADSSISLAMSQAPPPPYPGTPLKASEVVTMVEQAISPSLTVMSENSPSVVADSSRTGSFSIPRIEDSLEELDRLEEELEAIRDLTLPRGSTTANTQASEPNPVTPSGVTPSAPAKSKGASVAGYSATVRVKSSQKAGPSLRRSASLTLREKRRAQQGSSESQKSESSVSRSQSSINRLSTPKHPIKSAKPPTVPKFELPGEAVARRLREQREARQAQQQAEAQRSQTTIPKPRVMNKPLAKPTFELPGEAISRRKREEREAKLRAEEEEQRKRREFKARPVRNSIGPSTLPRETLTSRARQSRASPEANGENDSQVAQRKRMSVGVVRSLPVPSQVDNSSQTRGRNSTTTSTTEESRAASTSTGSAGGKRTSVSLEELHVQRQRGKDIFTRDNCYTQDREKTKRERELAAKTAREQAAERSRIASREWAEKKRLRGLAAKRAKATQEAGKEVKA
ncbi:hypothetical protein J3459_015374 [Metarhizium acridum]|uniref:uncharacterized protein n=1 Tax=Metarhizium acridum TaxID=92637 RepID=UPI001C6D0F7E|nr:hypothetical protein J3459_015374 [Metarhizium acridum]KAG8414066.1 hypothetical protein J3458_011719 [Metarhizium acridum]